MSNYTKTTDFEAKDSLPTGDAEKIIRGADFETEFDNISTAIATKADTAGPTFTGTLTFETISDGTIGVTAFVDEDDMVSDSATLVPTQQSVKAYVDSQVTAQDLDFQGDTGGALSIDLDSETLTVAGGTGIDTAGLGNTLTVNIDSTVATLTGTQTLTNKTLTSPDVNTPDIDGGTIDGTVIGGTTAAAGSFTTVSATGNITVGGTVDGRDVATDGTKLDGIEAGATADQTAAEIRTLVEAATDSNVFTDADHTKLNGIEASADVTDTANVTAAGALMDSELTSEASVKALNQGVATTDSPTFAGLTTTADVSFGDNNKAVFGAGSDLQIYHNGSNSYIEDAGTGSLIFRASTATLFQGKTAGENQLTLVENGAVTAYYDNSAKLATTSTGIDVTGTVTADGLTVQTSQGDITIPTSTSSLNFDRAGSNYIRATDAAGSFTFITGANDFATQRVKLLSNGDISFYEDTGTTAKFFWDASTSRLGLGTTSPATKLDVLGDTKTSNDFFVGDSIRAVVGAATRINFATASNISLDTAGVERMRIDSSGNVGIGTDSPAYELTVEDATGGAQAALISSTTGASILNMGDTANAAAGKITYENSSNSMFFTTASAEAMRIDSSGNVAIGTSSTAEKLRVLGNIRADATSTEDRFIEIGTGRSGNGYSFLDLVGDTTYTDYGLRIIRNNTGANTTSAIQHRGTGTLQLRTEDSADISFDTNTIERMRINSAGNVGIGTSSPTETLDVAGTFTSKGLSAYDEAAKFKNNGDAISWARADWVNDQVAGAGLIYRDENGQFVFRNDNSSGTAMTTTIMAGGSTAGITRFLRDGTNESMRIDSSGNLLVGTTSTSLADNGFKFLSSTDILKITSQGNQQLELNRNDAAGGTSVIFYTDETIVGTISVTASATAYNTSSDQRLKDNIVDAPSASDDIDAIQVRSFDWKADGSHQKYGMVAQELQSVAPNAVTEGETEEDMMSVDYSKLVPMLVKEIQSLRARVAQLEGAN